MPFDMPIVDPDHGVITSVDSLSRAAEVRSRQREGENPKKPFTGTGKVTIAVEDLGGVAPTVTLGVEFSPGRFTLGGAIRRTDPTVGQTSTTGSVRAEYRF
jgi:hypothetical protein